MMDFKDLTLEQKIGQVLCFGYPEATAADSIKEIIREHALGNIILFQRNFETCEQMYNMLKELQDVSMETTGIPLFVSIDQEGGFVTRLWNDATFFPGAMATAATGETDNAYIIGKAMGEEMRALGINLNFAPVLDINSNPENPVINTRSYGDTREQVVAFTSAYTKGLQENLIATGKHFPGHGDTHQDSHLTLPVVDYGKERLMDTELFPFKKLTENGIKAFMTTHIVFPAYDPSGLPATISEPILTGLLRNELGFDGLIVTDCMEMKAIANFYGTVNAVKMALNAGADIILISHTRETQLAAVKEIKEAVLADEKLMEKLDRAAARVLKHKQEILPAGTFEDMKKAVSDPAHKADAARISRDSITLYRGNCKTFKEDDTFGAVFFNARGALTGIENRDSKGDLEYDFKAYYKNAEAVVLSAKTSEADAERALEAVKKHENIVVFTYNAALFPGQAETVGKILEIRPDALVVAMRSPYDIRKFTQVKNYVLAYEYTPPAIESVLLMLRGGLEPKGKAPVDLLKGL